MNKRILISRIAAILAFFILLTLILSWFQYLLVLKREDGITSIQNMYAQEPDTCDIILLGSSHIGVNLDVEVLWKEHGYATYALWGSVQPFWNSYFFLLEALKTQTPELVVLDVYSGAYYHSRYADTVYQQTNTVGMRMGLNKLKAICVSAPPWKWANLVLQFPLFHSRIEELTADDFNHFPWSRGLINVKGTGYRYGNKFLELLDPSGITEMEAIHPKQEKYLRKIIEVCHNKDIELLLIKTPTVATRLDDQKYFNYIQTIADEYGLPFVNMNLLDSETGIRGEEVSLDGWHFNTSGARKLTSWLGQYIHSNYNIADHRGDPRYSSWDVFAEAVQKGYLKEIPSSADYFKELLRANYPVLIVQNGSSDGFEFQNLLTKLQILGVDPEYYRDSLCSSVFIPQLSNTGTPAQDICYSNKNEACEFFYNDKVHRVDFSDGVAVSVNDDTILSTYDSGMFVLVFDPNTNECVDIVSFYEYKDYSMTHYSGNE